MPGKTAFRQKDTKHKDVQLKISSPRPLQRRKKRKQLKMYLFCNVFSFFANWKTRNHETLKLSNITTEGGGMLMCPSFQFKTKLSNIRNMLISTTNKRRAKKIKENSRWANFYSGCQNKNWPIVVSDTSSTRWFSKYQLIVSRRGTDRRTLVVSLRATRPALSAASDGRHCAPPASSQTQTPDANTDSDVAETKGKGTAKTGKQKSGQKQLRSQISGSVSAGAPRSWGSQAGSRGGSLFCSQTTNTLPLAGFHFSFFFSLHLLSLKMQIKTA